MQPEKVHLTGEKQTLLITLHAKAIESRSPDSAEGQVRRSGAPSHRLRLQASGPRAGRRHAAMRAKAFDLDQGLYQEDPDAIVLNLGCGLDSRVFRVDPPPEIAWFDLDFPEVIDIRGRVYPKRGTGYRMIGASATDPSWLEQVPGDRPVMIVAEGFMPYLASDERRNW